MRRFCALFLLAAFASMSIPSAAWASAADAREVARLGNCSPKKISVYQQSLGEMGDTIYRVECTLAKADESAGNTPQADAVLIRCAGSLCELLRPINTQSK